VYKCRINDDIVNKIYLQLPIQTYCLAGISLNSTKQMQKDSCFWFFFVLSTSICEVFILYKNCIETQQEPAQLTRIVTLFWWRGFKTHLFSLFFQKFSPRILKIEGIITIISELYYLFGTISNEKYSPWHIYLLQGHPDGLSKSGLPGLFQGLPGAPSLTEDSWPAREKHKSMKTMHQPIFGTKYLQK